MVFSVGCTNTFCNAGLRWLTSPRNQASTMTAKERYAFLKIGARETIPSSVAKHASQSKQVEAAGVPPGGLYRHRHALIYPVCHLNPQGSHALGQYH